MNEERHKDRKINAAKVADIWNERARAMGKEGNYTRWSVRGRREQLDGEHTELGWLYSEEKARTIHLVPHSAKRPDMAERNRDWTRERQEKRRLSRQSENKHTGA